jgi:hypothetical protein
MGVLKKKLSDQQNEYIKFFRILPGLLRELIINTTAVVMVVLAWSVEKIIIFITLTASTIYFLRYKYIPFLKKDITVCHIMPYLKKTTEHVYYLSY